VILVDHAQHGLKLAALYPDDAFRVRLLDLEVPVQAPERPFSITIGWYRILILVSCETAICE
jgi:hypothetical protein